MPYHPIRPVEIACVCGPIGDDGAFLRLAEEAAAGGADLVALPEAWQGWGEADREGATERLRGIARSNRAYVLHPTILAEGGASYNAALLIGRGGEIEGRYEKLYPYWEEFPDVRPGRPQPLFDTDFGRVGAAICFDANFPSVWAGLSEAGAELVIWASAYGAGEQLAAHALNHHYPIVTATLSGHSMHFDIDGRLVDSVRADGYFVKRHVLDLDRCIFHENFNEAPLARLLSETPPRVEIERRREAEQWILVRSATEGAGAREACREAGMEELSAYKRRNRIEIDRMRGEG